jgi:hypothetical protein
VPHGVLLAHLNTFHSFSDCWFVTAFLVVAFVNQPGCLDSSDLDVLAASASLLLYSPVWTVSHCPAFLLSACTSLPSTHSCPLFTPPSGIRGASAPAAVWRRSPTAAHHAAHLQHCQLPDAGGSESGESAAGPDQPAGSQGFAG